MRLVCSRGALRFGWPPHPQNLLADDGQWSCANFVRDRWVCIDRHSAYERFKGKIAVSAQMQATATNWSVLPGNLENRYHSPEVQGSSEDFPG